MIDNQIRDFPTPGWPRQKWMLPLCVLIIMVGWAAYSVDDQVIANILLSISFLLVGCLFFAGAILTIRFGFFPSAISLYGPTKGVARKDRPFQFWATVLLFAVFGAGFFHASWLVFANP